MTRDPGADANPVTTNTLSNHRKDFVSNIKHSTHPFNTSGYISELLTFILENSTGRRIYSTLI